MTVMLPLPGAAVIASRRPCLGAVTFTLATTTTMTAMMTMTTLTTMSMTMMDPVSAMEVPLFHLPWCGVQRAGRDSLRPPLLLAVPPHLAGAPHRQ